MHLGVSAEEVEASCTKKESGGLHKAVCQGLPLPHKGSGSLASLSVDLVTFSVWLSFTLVIALMGVKVVAIVMQCPPFVLAREKVSILVLELEDGLRHLKAP